MGADNRYRDRATLDTIPFTCHSDESEKLIWDYANKAVSGNSSDTALGELWAITQNYVDKCKNSTYAASIGDKIGTAYIARDLISVVDALGEDGLLRFWGKKCFRGIRFLALLTHVQGSPTAPPSEQP